jgi:hypothetical protein
LYDCCCGTIRKRSQVKDHDNIDAFIGKIAVSCQRGTQGHFSVNLKPLSHVKQSDTDGTKLRVPKTYLQLNNNTSKGIATTVTSMPSITATNAIGTTAGAAATVTDSSNNGDLKLYPPANTDSNAYNMLKLYSLNGATVKALMRSRNQQISIELQSSGVSKQGLEFAFKVTAEEHKLIYYRPVHPRSTLLIGRSGTGKTTV